MQKKMTSIIDERLNEIDNGVLDGMTDEQIQIEYPEFREVFSNHNKDVRFPGGETGKEVKKRQDCLLEDLVQRNRFSIDTCGIIELEYEPSNKFWKVVRVNAKV